MTIKKIVLSTAAFGFAACNTLAMEKMEKLRTSEQNIQFFLVDTNGHLGYVGNTRSPALHPSILQHIPTRFRFGPKVAIEKALAEDKFLPCTLSSGQDAIVFGTTDKKYCDCANQLLAIKEILRRMPYDDPEARHPFGW